MTQMMLQNAPKTPQEMRAMLDGFAPFMNGELPEVGAFHEAVPVREGVTADVVVPKGAGPHPVLVYLHGGGWVCGSPKTHRKLGYRFAEAGTLVFNVDYRLAPEHPFPTPFEDCLAAVRWAQGPSHIEHSPIATTTGSVVISSGRSSRRGPTPTALSTAISESRYSRDTDSISPSISASGSTRGR